MAPPRVLILGHSFIRRLKDFIASHPDLNANFLKPAKLNGMVLAVELLPAEARAFDLPMVESFLPQIVILQVGSNDLVHADPLSIACAIEDLVTLLHVRFQVKRVCVYQTVYRESSPMYNKRVRDLVKYLKVLLEPLPYSFYWRHRGFWNTKVSLYSSDGVHLNSRGHYRLFRRPF